jgi:hypothetical protein
MSDKKAKDKEKTKDSSTKTDDEYVMPEPNTDSVPGSPVTGQTADESQEKPGQ